MAMKMEFMGLGSTKECVDTAMGTLAEKKVMARIWNHDHTVWKKNTKKEITNRLGWLRVADDMRPNLAHLRELFTAVREDGYTHVLLLGMGGSSLAPEVFRKTFGVAEGHLDLAVLDSTEPGAVARYADQLDPAKTLFVVATKSGGTAETLSFFKFFYNHTLEAVGAKEVGQHFVAITDPCSSLVDLAKCYRFRDTLLNDANIGGRYSALSYFGLTAAALVGVDLERLLDSAESVWCAEEPCLSSPKNPGARLGLFMGKLALAKRNKITFVVSPEMASFADWVEQLIAESTGKEGQGILPVVHEPLGAPAVYGNDRLFVQLRLEGDTRADASLDALVEAGYPLVRITLDDLYDLGGQLFLWEMATAVAGHVLKINPFDQPDVESAKRLTKGMIAAYEKAGKLPEVESKAPVAQVLKDFAADAHSGDYVTIQAYLTPSATLDEMLRIFRLLLRDRYRLATTTGYGPRYLHSTGQLHKGDAGNGLFIQLVANAKQDLAIPDEAGQPKSALSFGTLVKAQSMGDRKALLEKGRRVLRLDLGDDPHGALQALLSSLQ